MNKRWQDDFKEASLEEDRTTEDYYGVETENKLVKRFRLFLKEGRVLNIPYAWLPVYELRGASTLLIKTSDTQIRIQGRNLDQIEEWLNNEKLLWVSESVSIQDTHQTDVFIQSIKVEGNLMH